MSPAQIERAREIGYSLCDPPIGNRRQAELDPVGYAEKEFSGPDEFDQARVEGCIDALTD